MHAQVTPPPRTPADDELGDDDPGYVILTDEEFAEAKQRALDSVGLTYEQLAEQARQHRFSSFEAKQVWFLFSQG
ncbi:hypothetical protein [Herbidospora sp. RD11066]